jgi:hypothetical protein
MMEVGFFGHNFILIAKGILTAMFDLCLVLRV